MPYTDLPPRRSSLSRRSGENATGSRRGSRVHFDDEERPSITDDIVREYAGHSGGPAEDTPVNVPEASHTRRASVDWNIPDYEHDGVSPATPRQRGGNVSPRGSRNEGHRDSDATLYEIAEAARSPESKYSTSSFASYKHPDDIRPPRQAYTGSPSVGARLQPPDRPRAQWDGNEDHDSGEDSDDGNGQGEGCNLGTREDRHRGYLANLMDLYANEQGGGSADDKQGRSKLYRRVRHNSFDSAATTSTRYDLHRMDSFASNGSQVLDPDDPTVTGERKNTLDGNSCIAYPFCSDHRKRICAGSRAYFGNRHQQKFTRMQRSVSIPSWKCLARQGGPCDHEPRDSMLG